MFREIATKMENLKNINELPLTDLYPLSNRCFRPALSTWIKKNVHKIYAKIFLDRENSF